MLKAKFKDHDDKVLLGLSPGNMHLLRQGSPILFN
jgi:hypothetical protein